MNASPLKIKKQVKSALRDDVLRAAVRMSTRTALDKRQKLVDAMPEWEDLRRALHAAKRDVVEHLDR